MMQYITDSRTALDECNCLDADETAKRQIIDTGFDFLLVDVFPLGYCFSFLPLMLGVPFAVYTSTYEVEQFRSGMLPSFVPHPLSEYSDNMTFWERLHNLYMFLKFGNQDFTSFPAVSDKRLVQKYRTDSNMANWNDVVRKASLMFLPRDYLTEWPIPLLPHVVPLEGITCRTPEELPGDMEVFMQSAKHGVIVVSFGSSVTWLPDVLTQKFLESFAQRDELVLWKFKVTDRHNFVIPQNVKMMSWLPQNDVLGHTKV